MRSFFFQVIFLLLLVFLQFSFFGIVFPWFRAPLFLVGAVVAFTLVRGFPGTLFMVVPLVLLFDAITLGAVSWFSLYAVFFAYVTSFLSRRLLIEHRGLGLGLYTLVAYGVTLLYQFLHAAVVYDDDAASLLSFRLAAPSVENLLFSLVAFVPIFVVTYLTIKRFEDYLETVRQKQFRGIR